MSKASDINNRRKYPRTQTVVLVLTQSMVLKTGLVFGWPFSCTVFRPQTGKSGLKVLRGEERGCRAEATLTRDGMLLRFSLRPIYLAHQQESTCIRSLQPFTLLLVHFKAPQDVRRLTRHRVMSIDSLRHFKMSEDLTRHLVMSIDSLRHLKVSGDLQGTL